MAIEKEVEQKVRVRAWFGTTDDLLRLVANIEESFEPERAAEESQLPKPTPRYSGSERARHAKAWTATTSAKNHRGHTITGPLDELLATNNEVPLTEISYRYPSYGAVIKAGVRFSISVSDGMHLTISGSNQFGIEAVKSMVATDTKRNCPWWTWFLTTLSGAITEYAILALAFYGLTTLLARHVTNNVAGTALAVLGSFVGPGFFWLTRWRRFSPLFEILRSRDQPPAAYKLLRWLAGLLGTVAVALMVAFAAR